MKALSLLQPWATLVVLGAKKIETRSWATAYRGKILIHASSGKKGSTFSRNPLFMKYIPDFKKLPFGAIIGEATLTNILPVNELRMRDETIERLTLEEKAFGDYSEGRWAWLLEDAIEYEQPVPARGMLGLWDYYPV